MTVRDNWKTFVRSLVTDEAWLAVSIKYSLHKHKRKIRFLPQNDIFERSYLWICQSFLSAMHQNVLICFSEIHAQSKAPTGLSLTRLCLYIPIQDGFRLHIYTRCPDLVLACWDRIYIFLSSSLSAFAPCYSAPYLIHFNIIHLKITKSNHVLRLEAEQGS